MKKIAILASGSGTNAENIVKTFHEGNKIRVGLVIANREKAGVHQRMQALGVPSFTIPNSVWDNEPMQIVEVLKSHEIDLVVLAGFMHKVDTVIIDAFRGRIINIHPSLLPAYGGKGMWGHHVHEAVIANGEKQSGVTVHYVTEDIDKGEILMQQSIDLVEGETAESLEAKIHPVEYELYPRAIVAAISRLETVLPPEIPSVADSASTLNENVSDEGESSDADSNKSDDALRTVDEQWAETLGLAYDKEVANATAVSTPPPYQSTSTPNVQIPPVVQQPMPPCQQPSSQMPQEPMPQSYLLIAVLMTVLCCMIPGIVAIVFASKVSSKYYEGDIEGAKQASKTAQMWIIISFVLGLLSATLYVPIMIIKNALLG